MREGWAGKRGSCQHYEKSIFAEKLLTEEESIIVSNRLFTDIQKILERQNEAMGVFPFWH